MKNQDMPNGFRWGTLVGWALLLVAIIFFILPVVYLSATVFKSPGDVLQGRLLPMEPTLENLPAVLDRSPLLAFMRNSVIASFGSGLITMLITVPATYAMVKLRVATSVLPNFTLSTYLAPPVVALIPLFFLLQNVGLMDNVFGLAVVYGLMNTPVAFWLLRNFVREIPNDIDEAAWVDGAGYWWTLLRIVLPLLMPGIVATSLVCIILAYNEFLFASAMTFGNDSRTVTVGISLFQGERLVNFGQMAAASLVGMVPVYFIAFLFQRWLIGGLMHGSVK
ncbi:carbohydrate ABC transporter permease [Microvirga sp. GCM10011540]|uniref:carbohydrate ABC transporter permease n=1 Tax=Microvirga sp. GCM10011540 TaxID=3317338 RepID=UPI003623B861